MKITVQYEVPVYVEVDTDSKTVERVVVDDTSAVSVRHGWSSDDEEGLEDLEVGDLNRAYHIAENSNWPAWDFGW